MDVPVVPPRAGTGVTEGGRENYTHLEKWGEDQGPDRYDVEDSVRAFVRSTTGTSIALNVAWAANQPDDTTITLTGSDRGASLAHETGELEPFHAADSTEPQLLGTSVETRDEDPHRDEQRRFFEAVAGGEPPRRNTVEQGYYVQRLIDAIFTAGETGESVLLAESAIPGTPAD